MLFGGRRRQIMPRLANSAKRVKRKCSVLARRAEERETAVSHPSARPRKLSFTSGFTLFARIWTSGSRTAAGGHFYTWFVTLKTANGNKPRYGYYCIVNVDKRRVVPPLKLPKKNTWLLLRFLKSFSTKLHSSFWEWNTVLWGWGRATLD